MRHWDLRDDCLIISGQMRHFAPDFIAFLIHYSSLTSHDETQFQDKQQREENINKLCKVIWRRRGKRAMALGRHVAALRFSACASFLSDLCKAWVDLSTGSVILSAEVARAIVPPITTPLFCTSRLILGGIHIICVTVHNIMKNSVLLRQRILRGLITGAPQHQICWCPHRRELC